jgi:methylated-DNA-[protein]-cysteine S-methyltransferase
MIALALRRLDTPIGELLVVQDDAGALHAVEWADHEARMLGLLARYNRPSGVSLVHEARGSEATQAIAAYFHGDLGAIADLSAAPGGTAFQRRVWAGLRQVSPGTTTTYAALAAGIGAASAVRATGAANGANPVSVVVPCHRVLGSNGALTGYGSGVARKRWLLDHEAAHGNPVARIRIE